MPWLPVFIRQLGHSAAPFSAKATGASIYALWAGEVSTPFGWWVSLPVLVAAVTACILILIRFRQCALPALIAAVLFSILVAKNVIWTKRLLIFTPFLALAIGIALHSAPVWRGGLWTRVRRVFLVASAIAIFGGLINVFRRDRWMTYRWIVPVESVVRQTLAANPNTVLLTNSNCVAFYAADPVGCNLASLKPERVSLMRTLPCYPGFPAAVEEVMRGRLSHAASADYIHDSSSVRFTDVSAWLKQTMQAQGFLLESIENHAEASEEYLRFHPGGGKDMVLEDRSRLLVVHFKRVSNL